MSVPPLRFVLTAALLGGLLAGGAVGLDRLTKQGSGGGGGPGTIAPAPVQDASPPSALTLPGEFWVSEPPVPRGQPVVRRPPVLALSGDFPTEGPGRFRFAGGESEVLGDGSGPLRRFRVGVEDGVDADPDRVARFVVETLADQRGWTARGEVRFQQVPDGGGHDFTIYLATSATAAEMCAEVGLDVVGSGLPDGGVSCRTPGRAILNLSRWRTSVPQYVAQEVPLETYRRMVVNHEVGHELGYGHLSCPGPGELAPIMQQQTIDLAGCRPNPWPYPDAG